MTTTTYHAGRIKIVEDTYIMHRRFRLLRVDDVSGVCGTGYVAEGVEFSNGMVTVSFIGPCHGVETWTSMTEMKNVHGHGGKTKVQFEDADPADAISHETVQSIAQ